LCIKLVSIKELYYDARPNKSQDLHCKTSKTDIPLQEDQNKIVQNQCGHLVQQDMQDYGRPPAENENTRGCIHV